MKYEARHSLTVAVNETIPLEPPARGFRTQKVGEEKRQVDVVIDIDAIVRKLGLNAVRNKSGRASGLSGMVVVKRVGRSPTR